jgi:hypothetical protein
MVIKIREKDIDIMLKDLDKAHSEYQIENFIVGSEVHPWHQYKQALREIASRREALVDQNEKLSFIESEIKRFERWRPRFGRKKQIHYIRLTQEKRKRKKLIVDIANNEEEMNCFVRCAAEIRHMQGFNSLTFEKRKAIEAEAWREKAKWMICLDLYCFGKPSKGTIEFITKLPKSIRRELIIKLSVIKPEEVKQYFLDI